MNRRRRFPAIKGNRSGRRLLVSESRRQQSPTGESRLGAELDASELVKEVKIKLNILYRTNYRFDSKRKVLQETAETVAID